jgi:hypothetical protein
MKSLLFIRELNMDFWMRVVFFGGVVYFTFFKFKPTGEGRVSCKEEAPFGKAHPNKFSKTFGQEKELDNILR